MNMDTTTMMMAMNSNHSMAAGTDHSMHNMNSGTDHSMHNMDHSHHPTANGTNCTDHSSHCMDHSSMGHMMQMYFHTGYSEYVLFKELKTESEGALIGACFAVFFVAILYEGLKFARETLLQRSLLSRGPAVYMEKLPAGSSQEQMVMQMQNTSMSSRMLSSGHVLQTFLHIVQVFISYCLMLVFMTYNVWLCVAVVVGAGVGYFFFGWKRAVVVDSNEHCH